MNDCFKINNLASNRRDLTIKFGKYHNIPNTRVALLCRLFFLHIPSNDENKYNTGKEYNLKYEKINENNVITKSKEYKNTKMDFKISIFNIYDNTAKQYLKILGVNYNENQKIKFIELLNDENFALLLAEKFELPIELLIETDFFRKDCFISDILKYKSVNSLSLVIRVLDNSEYTTNITMINNYNRRKSNFGDTITHKYYADIHGSILKNRFVKIPENITIELGGIPGYIFTTTDTFNFYDQANIHDIINNQLCPLNIYDDYIFDITLSFKDFEINLLKKENKDELFRKTFIKVPDNNDRNITKEEDPRKLYFENIFLNYSSNLRSHVPLSGIMRMLSLLYKNEKIVINVNTCLGINNESKEDYMHYKNSFYVHVKDLFNNLFNDEDKFVYSDNSNNQVRAVHVERNINTPYTFTINNTKNKEYYDKLKEIINNNDDRLCVIRKINNNNNTEYRVEMLYENRNRDRKYINIYLTKEEYDKLEKKYGKNLCLYNYNSDEFIKKLSTDKNKFPQFEKDNIEKIVPNWVEECYKNKRWDKNKPIVFYSEDNNIK